MKHLQSAVMNLALTYLSIIMVMSIGFSAIFYSAASHQLDRRSPQSPGFNAITRDGRSSLFADYMAERAEEGRAELRVQLLLVNIAALVLGGLLSYLLAERTLRPIEDNMEAQVQFVGDASHELRTPLTALRTSNEVALRNRKLTLSQAKEVIAGTVEEAHRLQDLTNAMLGLLQDEDRTLFRQKVNLSRATSDALNTVVSQALAKDIAVVDTVAAVAVRGNHQSLVQLLTILFDNAIKYSQHGSTVRIASEIRGKHVILSVRDEGMGMDGETMQSIFTRFYRADKARARKGAEGYGLGLAIAQKIVDAHGGKIRVESTVGQGSTFTVTLPRVKS